MDDDGFIGLPPGMAPIDPNSGTVRRERPERPRAEREEIVFFPVGAAVPSPEPLTADAEAEVEVPEPVLPGPQATEPLGRADLEEATRASAPRRHTAGLWRVVVDGRTVPVEGLLYLGRNPVAAAGHQGAHVLSLDDSTKSVSKTHAMLELDGDELWVHDLDSTNGVWVVPEGAEAIEVTPGQRVRVPAGADLELGDVVIQVERG